MRVGGNTLGFIVCLIFLISGNLTSQQLSQNIKGTIIDTDTKFPVGMATVVVLNTNPLIGTISGMDGKFRLLNIALGRQSLRISCIGYQDAIVPDIIVGSGKEIFLNIELRPALYEGGEVVVRGRQSKESTVNSMTPVSARRFSVEEANRYAGGFNDLSRMATAFAGVGTFNGESNEIVIRGNSPRGLLWRIEGIEISNPNHFPRGDGASGGGISILTSDIILDSDFLTGAFAPEFGNALSGVFDINLRKGNQENYEYSLRIGAIGVEGMAEGPILKKCQGSFLINYRYSTLALLESAGFRIVDNTVVPTFQDLAFNISLPTKRMGAFLIFGLSGISLAGEKANPDSSEWHSNSDRLEESEIHRMGAIGIRHFYFFKNNKSYLRTVALINGEQNNYFTDSLDNTSKFIRIYDERIQYNTLRTSILLNHKINSKNIFRSGIIMSRVGFIMNVGFLKPSIEKPIQLIDNNGSTGLLQGYIQWKHYASENIELITGFHSMYFLINNEITFEPRFGFRWKFAGNQSASFGFGMHSRIEPVSMYYYRFYLPDRSFQTPNKNLRSTKSIHNVAGYSLLFKQHYMIKAELYVQYLYDVPVDALGTTTFSTLNYRGGIENHPLNNDGIGYNYGLELTAERYLFKGFYFLFTASLFDSKYRAADSVFYNTAYNSHYIFNCLGGKEFKIGQSGNITLGLNTRLYLKGGNRITPIDLELSRETGSVVYIHERTFMDKTSDFIRWDTGISINLNRPKYASHITVDLQNVLNRKNIYTQYYDNESQSIKYLYGLPFIPVFNFKIEF